MELIDRKELMKYCTCHKDCKECDFYTDGDSWCGGEVFGTLIMNMPTVDAKKEVHAGWEIAIGYDERRKFMCSECHRMAFEATRYCPSCGAKMDEDGWE